MMTKKIVITGGPSSGKTSLIKHLEALQYPCMPEISREIIIEAQQQGIDQLFLEDPILFSQKLLDGRLKQFHKEIAHNKDFLFYDRGLPDITAYMDYLKTEYPNHFVETCTNYLYDFVFILPPWEAIYQQDNERYETFEEAQKIHQYLVASYHKCNYNVIEVPTGTLSSRANFILNILTKT
ncbi:MAG: AAA family ATPase [Flavobacteriales bacterium]